MRYLLARTPRPGARPGDLESDEELERELPLHIYRIDYGGGYPPRETAFDDGQAALADPTRRDGLTWLHFEGDVTPSLLAHLRETFKLHALAVEDVLHRGQRPKLELYEDSIFAIVAHPRRDQDGLHFEQVSLFAGNGYVLSFHAGSDDIFQRVRQRIHDNKGRIGRAEPDYLCYCLADVVVDHGFPLIEDYADDLDALEEEIFAGSQRNPVAAIHTARRDLIAMRKILYRQSAMVSEWVEADHPLFNRGNMPYFRDLEDHAQRVADLLDGYRDATANLLDTHLSLSSARLNDIMKMLTLIATIFMPLTFIAGIYGMNFDPQASPWNMPELSAYYGYPLTLLVMLLTAGGMFLYFRHRHWL